MKTRITFLVLMLATSIALKAQQHMAPLGVKINEVYHVEWMNPDKYFTYTFDFADGQMPEGWHTYSWGGVFDPWHIETPESNPGLDFPADHSPYLYAQSDQLNGSTYVEEYVSHLFDSLPDLSWASVEFDYALHYDLENGTRCKLEIGSQTIFSADRFTPAEGHVVKSRGTLLSSDFARFMFRSYSPLDYFAIDNLRVYGEHPEWQTHDVQAYRLWLDGQLLGDYDLPECAYDLPTDTLTNDQYYTLSVAAVYDDGVSDPVSVTFRYLDCSSYETPFNLSGGFVDEHAVELTWNEFYMDAFRSGERGDGWENDFVTHHGVGYHNGWDVSALHSGLADYGFNVDHQAGYRIKEPFVPSWMLGGMTFYAYQGNTPDPTITEAYLAFYDGDPDNGGQLVAGSLDAPIPGVTVSYALCYRTAENDFSDVSRPVVRVRVPLNLDFEPGRTYWYVLSLSGTLQGGVWAVPVTSTGITTTGEAQYYDTQQENWQPLLDSGTGTQQGLCYQYLWPGGGGADGPDYATISRDGVVIDPHWVGSAGHSSNYFYDEGVSPGRHTYTIVNHFGQAISCPVDYDVYYCYPAQMLRGLCETTSQGFCNHLFWEPEVEMEDVEPGSTYVVYRRHITEEDFYPIGAVAKDSSEHYEFYDEATLEGISFYKVMVNNVYASGYCESTFALTADDPTTTELRIDTDPNSVAEQADKAIVYPNPTDGRISISTTTSAQVSIYDANGQKVMHGNGRCFDLSHLAPGLYLVEVVESTGQRHLERIMKR